MRAGLTLTTTTTVRIPQSDRATSSLVLIIKPFKHSRFNPGLTSCSFAGKHGHFIRLWEGASDLGVNDSMGKLSPICTGDLAKDVSAAIAMHDSVVAQLQRRVKLCQIRYIESFSMLASKLNK